MFIFVLVLFGEKNNTIMSDLLRLALLIDEDYDDDELFMYLFNRRRELIY
jgi:hypothetical protein